MKLEQEQIDRYRELTAAFTRAARAAQLAKLQLEAFETEIHLDTPAGQRFDVWGDGELKPDKECLAPPGTK